MISNAFLSLDAIGTLVELRMKSNLFNSNESIRSKVNIHMQIIQSQYNSAFNLFFYCLSDLTHHYANFLIKKIKGGTLCINDILNITEVESYIDTQHSVLVFYIKAYKVICNMNFGVMHHTKLYLGSDRDHIETEKTIEYKAKTNKEYSMIKDIPPSNPSYIVLLIKVKRKSSIIRINNKSNDKNEFYFYFEGEDEDQCRLRVFAFSSQSQSQNKTAIPYYSMIHLGGYYQIQGEFNVRRGTFSMFLDNIPEIYLCSQSKVMKLPVKNPFPPLFHHLDLYSNITTIKEILSSPNYLLVSILVSVLAIKEMDFESINDKPEGRKRMMVADTSGFKIEVSLYSYYALYPIKEKDILLLESFQINPHSDKDIDIKKLTTVFESTITINPNLEKAFALRNLLCNNNKMTFKRKFSELDGYNQCLISQLRNNGREGKVKIKGIINDISLTLKNIYEGCPVKSCMTQLVYRNMNWHCPQCCSGPVTPNYYYTFHISIQDCSGMTKAILIDQCATKYFKINAFQYKNYLQDAKEILKNIVNPFKYFEMYFFSDNAHSNPLQIHHLEGIDRTLESRALAYKLFSNVFYDKFLLSDCLTKYEY